MLRSQQYLNRARPKVSRQEIGGAGSFPFLPVRRKFDSGQLATSWMSTNCYVSSQRTQGCRLVNGRFASRKNCEKPSLRLSSQDFVEILNGIQKPAKRPTSALSRNDPRLLGRNDPGILN
jgi:hypothetical protein